MPDQSSRPPQLRQVRNFREVVQVIVDRFNADQTSPEVCAKVQQDVEQVLAAGVTSYLDLLNLAALPGTEKDVRLTAIWLLGQMDEPSGLAALVPLLKDADPELRVAAAQAIPTPAVYGDPAPACAALIAALADDVDPSVRYAAAYALGLIADPVALGPLLAALANPAEDPEVRAMAAEGLGYLGDRSAVHPLLLALFDPEVEVRYWSAFSLGNLGDARALPFLERAATGDLDTYDDWGTVSAEAQAAIARIQGACAI